MRAGAVYYPRNCQVYAFQFTGQPRSVWPKWLRDHYGGQFPMTSSGQFHGKIAVATIKNDRRTFDRWHTVQEFHERFRKPRP